MDPQPLVSIIIPNYNYGQFIGQAIDSALGQTYQNVEVIVVDDGSTDDSVDVISAYQNKLQFILKENGGQASAVNAGFEASHGDIIVILDADDFLNDGAVSEVVKAFDNEKIVKVHWPLWRTDEEGNKTGKKLPDDILSEGDLKDQVITFGPAHCGGPPNSPPTSGNAWARWFLEKVLPIPEDVFKGGIDNYLFVLTPVYGEIKSLKEPHGFYRVHGANNTLKLDYMTTFFNRFEACCEALSYHLRLNGIFADPAKWPRNHWFHIVAESLKAIEMIIPDTATLILIDDDAWNAGSNILGRPRKYLLEYKGHYGGIPGSDEDAIISLEQLRNNGAQYIVFVWSSFWWLEYFKAFNKHLVTKYPCILQNDQLLIFDLTEQSRN